jgi:hypothetical protein
MTLTTMIGLLGVVGVLVAYGLMTLGKWRADSARYQALNVIGTAGILVSLIDQWNVAAFVANVAWIAIGVLSLVRIYKRQKAGGA